MLSYFALKQKVFQNKSYIAIHSDHRRRGLASTFMKFMESYGAAHNCQTMYLDVRENNQAAIPTY